MNINVVEEYIETGNHQDLELLISKEPQLLKELTSHQITPLLLACYYNKKQVIKTILKYTSTISIHEACATGLTSYVEKMIEHKKDIVEELSTNGFTPLGIATHFNKEDITRILLTNKANPNKPSHNEYMIYPLHTALSANNESISKMLIEAGADVNAVQHGQIAPIHLAAQFGNIELIILLLEQGADISVRTQHGESASDIAAKKGFMEIAEILKIS